MTQPYALYNPATHVAVPREATEVMLRASSRGDAKRAAVYYRAMLAAAPPHVVEIDPTRSDVALATLILERLGYSVGENQHRVDWVAGEICKFREAK